MQPARPAHRRRQRFDPGDPAQQMVPNEGGIVAKRSIASGDDESLPHRDEPMGHEEIPAAKDDDFARLGRRGSDEGLHAQPVPVPKGGGHAAAAMEDPRAKVGSGALPSGLEPAGAGGPAPRIRIRAGIVRSLRSVGASMRVILRGGRHRNSPLGLSPRGESPSLDADSPGIPLRECCLVV